MLRIGWFATARGDSSLKLLEAAVESIRTGQLKAQIEFVFCSRELGESEKTDAFLSEVRGYGIPLVSFSVKRFAQETGQTLQNAEAGMPEWRLQYDREVIARLGDYHPDICVLAGYMLIVGPGMCERYNMINLHPALPDGPKGTWQEVIWTLIEQQAHESGVMMHLVTPDLDRGPVITYCRFRLRGQRFDPLWKLIEGKTANQVKTQEGENSALFKAIRHSGFARETPLILCTLKAFSEGKIKIDASKRLLDANGKAVPGYDLTREIDLMLAKSTGPIPEG